MKKYDFLIVDDSKLARSKIRSYLDQLGYNVVGEACDGLEALRMSSELKPTYICIDLEMPNMKGNEASQKILALNPDINIILITSIINKNELINATKIGVKQIMQKPVTFEAFKDVISKIN